MDIRSDSHIQKKQRNNTITDNWTMQREQHGIVVEGQNIPNPIQTIDEIPVRNEIKDEIRKAKFPNKLTPIQRQLIPVLSEGRDALAIASTGTGKVLSYLIPMLEFLLRISTITHPLKMNCPYALIIAPTRELALSTEYMVRQFASVFGLRSACVVGGSPLESQLKALKEGREIIVATPGRLWRLLEEKYLSLMRCCFVVFEELDRTLDMGFEIELRNILDALPKREEITKTEESFPPENKCAEHRVICMFASSLTDQIESFAKPYMRNPAVVIAGAIKQILGSGEIRIEWTTPEEKKQKLLQVLQHSRLPTLVYTTMRKTCVSVTDYLEQSGQLDVVSMHGNQTQAERVKALNGFNDGTYDVLVCTDVASRGLDLRNVNSCIHYDMPDSTDLYCFRMTGRSGIQSTMLITIKDDQKTLDKMKTDLRASGYNVVESLRNLLK